MAKLKFDFQLQRLNTEALALAYFIVPWDSEIFGFPVAQISEIQVSEPLKANADLKPFLQWLEQQKIRLASCRVLSGRLDETMLLEQVGFRFVEMVLHPHIEDLQAYPCASQGLQVQPAEAVDLAAIERIATHAFGYERFHIDPRLSRLQADQRYLLWVRNSYGHETQRLYKICQGTELLAFFIVENKAEGESYWHLTAVAPQFQGKGFGKRVWLEMLHFHQQEGRTRICTTIASANIRVLNLYSRLGFRFRPPEITLHWLRSP